MESSSSTTPSLCLNMIVKNESKIIKRLLESVAPIIDCYCICDTGSTDNTEEIIDEFFKSRFIPGKIVKEPFKNFEHNRSFALKACLGMSDFVLLMDADMILLVGDQFKKNKLNGWDCFYILQGNENFYYQNTRIIRNSDLYSYSGVTHEFVNMPGGSSLHRFEKNELFIMDIGDGGSKSDKYERDVRLLLNGIEEVKDLPGKPLYDRYHFYLANSYHDSGQYEKAIEYYKKRVEIGGWEQEVWYSYYRIGLCYKKLSKIGDAIYYWMLGYDSYPKRIENLYEIMNHYRENGKHKLANHYYEIAKNILSQKLDKDNYLFLHNDIYTYKLDYEYTIICYYLGVKNINNEIVNILNYSSDQSIIQNSFKNMKFYKDFLKPLKTIDLTNTVVIPVNSQDTNFYSSSSCLIPNENKDGYLLNVRYVNYYINQHGRYLYCEKHIITANKYMELNNDLQVTKEKFFDLNFQDRQYVGVEDVRIFNDTNSKEIIFTGTGYLQNQTIGIVRGKYDTNNDILSYDELSCSFNKSECEKNWVFVDYKKETHMIYSWSPLKIGKINDSTLELELVETRKMPKFFSHVRGSSCGFKYKKVVNVNIEELDSVIRLERNEIWFVAHLVSYEQPRCYYHVFVVLDEDLNLLRYSAPFKMEDICIEYSLSVVVEDERVLLNYSGWDRTTKIGVYDKKYIDSMIKYKP
jgi:tetratricopeptide (TPR) repeat protein